MADDLNLYFQSDILRLKIENENLKKIIEQKEQKIKMIENLLLIPFEEEKLIEIEEPLIVIEDKSVEVEKKNTNIFQKIFKIKNRFYKI